MRTGQLLLNYYLLNPKQRGIGQYVSLQFRATSKRNDVSSRMIKHFQQEQRFDESSQGKGQGRTFSSIGNKLKVSDVDPDCGQPVELCRVPGLRLIKEREDEPRGSPVDKDG